MDITNLLAELKEKQLSLQLAGEQLKLRGQRESITKDILSRIERNKPEIISFLRDSYQEAADSIAPIEEQDHYPTSHVQQRFWFINQFEPQLSVYNIPSVFRLSGAVDPAGMEWALREVLGRHENLRSFFVLVDGNVRQRILDRPGFGFEFRVRDIARDSLSYGQAFSMANEEACVPFELDKGPLLRAMLVRYAPAAYLLVITAHHIVFDGESSNVLLNDFAFYYNHYRTGAGLPRLEIQHKDFVAWQNRRLGSALVSSEKFWLDVLKGKLPVLELSDPKKRPPVKTHRNANHKAVFPGASAAFLESFCARHKVSPFVVILTGLKMLFARYTGETDIILGTPVSGRGTPALEHQVGLFLNTVALRTRVDLTKPFGALALDVKATVLNAFHHQAYPFDALVEKLNVARDPSRSPIFDFLFVSLDYGKAQHASGQIAGIETDSVESDFSGNKFDFTVYFSMEERSVEFSYNTDLFDQRQMGRMAQHLLNAIAYACQHPETPVAKIDFRTPEEKQFLDGVFNHTIRPYRKHLCLHHPFEAQAANHPGRIAIEAGDLQLSYGALNARANRIAAALLQAGVAPGDRVGLVVHRTPDMVAGMLGILKSGAAYVPIDPAYPDKRKQYIIAKGEISFILHDAGAAFPLPEGLRSVCLNDGLDGFGEENPDAGSDPQELAYIIFTSGSTGDPKGVMIEHHSAINLIDWVNQEFAVNAAERLLFITSMCFDLSVYDIFGTLAAGGTLVMANEADVHDPVRLAKLLVEKRITFWDSVPASMLYVLNALDGETTGYRQHDLRVVFLSGDWIPVELPRRITGYFPNAAVISLGGATEGTVWSNFFPVGEVPDAWTSIPYGRPIANNFFYILDDQLHPVPTGIAGNLYIGGAGVARGYAGDPERTRESFVNDPFNGRLGGRMYRTGDLGRMMEDGQMEFLGRTDGQVKIRGFRVGLGEVASALSKHPQLRNVAVIDRLDNDNVRFLEAYYESEQAVAAAALQSFLRETLPGYMIPSVFTRLKKIPLNDNQKIDRNALPLLPRATDGNNGSAAGKPRLSRLQRSLIGIWQEVLGARNIAAGDNFFEIGGHSLNSTRVLSRIHEQLNVRLDLRTIFTHPTVEQLAGAIEGGKRSTVDRIAPLEEQDHYPVSAAQRRLWVLSQMEESSLAYQEHWTQKISGNFDVDAMRNALDVIVERHEILRTTFAWVGGEARQVVHDPRERKAEFNHINASGETAIAQIIDAHRAAVMDVSRGPLMRVLVISTGPAEHILLLTLHHIICDGWSIEVLIQSFFALYKNAGSNGRDGLPERRLQYKDFTVWQHAMTAGERVTEWQAFWHEKLRDVPILELPVYQHRPQVQTYNGHGKTFILGNETQRSIKKLAARHQASMFMTFYALMNVLFYRYTGQSDIVLGTIDAGRDHPDLEDQIGYYLNTLALRTSFDPRMSFTDVLDVSRKNVLEALEHKLYPFERIVEELQLKRDISRSPVFDVLIEVNQFGGLLGEEQGVADVTAVDYEVERTTSIYDLNFVLHDEPGHMLLEIHYNSDLFLPGQIDGYCEHFEALVAAIDKSPATPVKAHDIVPPKEKALLDSLAGYPVDFGTGKTILTALEEVVSSAAAMPAFQHAQEALTFEQLATQALRVGKFLRTRVPVRETPVAVLLQRNLNLPVAILAIWKSGCSYLPIDPETPLDRIKTMIDDSAAPLIICDRSSYHIADELLWQCRGLNDVFCIDADDTRAIEEPRLLSMSAELWQSIAERAKDDIGAGGWISSYTGAHFSRKEMDEYADNIWQKLAPHLTPSTRILEVGCASGITMFRLAPIVGHYHGTDMSAEVLAANARRIEAEKIPNVTQSCLYAHEIDQLAGNSFDIVIINSVLQYFGGTNYLVDVLEKCCNLLAPAGLIFVGDVMDLDRKEALLADLRAFKVAHAGEGFKTTTDFPDNKFYTRQLFDDLRFTIPVIVKVEHSEKIRTVENELTQYRFDTKIFVDKTTVTPAAGLPAKNKFGAGDLAGAQSAELPVVGPDDLAYIIYTSGSTGRPKGVMIDHKGMLNHLNIKKRDLPVTARSVVAQNAPQSFDISIWQLFAGILSGARTVIYGKQLLLAPPDFLVRLASDQVTILEVVPSYLASLLETPPEIRRLGFAGLQCLVVTGERLSEPLVEAWFEAMPQVPLVNAYGPTEASDDITHMRMVSAPRRRAVPIGSPLPNFRIFILNESKMLCPVGVKGEIHVSGLGISRGYLNDPEKTAERFTSHPLAHGKMYATGDIGRMLPDGTIDFFGRLDHQLKIRGHRVEVAEIERSIESIFFVKEAVVMLLRGSDELCAYVVYKEHFGSQPDAVRKELSTKIPGYMTPTYIVELEAFPVTKNGKVDRDALPDPRISVAPADDYLAPQGERETLLASIWSAVLDRPHVGRDRRFFEIGGDSIKAIQVIARLTAATWKLDIRDIYQHQTIEALAPLLVPVTRVPDQRSVSGKVLPTPIQRYFFEEFLTDPQHYNQAMLLKSKRRLSPRHVQAAFTRLLAHHDILRARLVQHTDGPCLQVEESMDFDVAVHDLRTADAPDAAGEVTRVSQRLQESIQLETGPLMKIAVFQLHDGDRLLIVFHHLVIDGVSWRVILEDLQQAYESVSAGKPGRLPLKTDSYQLWAKKLREYAMTAACMKELSYWENVCSRQPEHLKSDFGAPSKRWLKDRNHVSFSLGDGETATLLGNVNHAYNTEINDILLAALAMTMRSQHGFEHLTFELEGHGRENIGTDLDINRTVGWFSAEFPVSVKLPPEPNPRDYVMEVKETLRRVPNKGIGYGILRYLTVPQLGVKNNLAIVCPIGFNYLGQFDGDANDADDALFTGAEESFGETQSRSHQVRHSIDISGIIVNRMLSITIAYNADQFARQTITALAEAYQRNLVAIIAHCASKQTTQQTPSDFGYKDLTVDELANLFD